jgi:outer membrane protein OmpA-like peptidoglycan-associated protein
MKRYNFLIFIMILLGLSVAVDVVAEEAIFDETHRPTLNEVVQALKPADTQSMKLRGINYQTQMPEPKMISLKLEFEKGSAQLTQMTKENLDIIGEALNSAELQGLKFTIEGHADASGSDAFNLLLSKKRAESVKQYLVKTHNVNSTSFEVVGKGKQDLLDPSDPYSMKNRRVRIITNQ